VPVFPAQLAESACWKAAVAGSADAGGLAVVAELDLEPAYSPTPYSYLIGILGSVYWSFD